MASVAQSEGADMIAEGLGVRVHVGLRSACVADLNGLSVLGLEPLEGLHALRRCEAIVRVHGDTTFHAPLRNWVCVRRQPSDS